MAVFSKEKAKKDTIICPNCEEKISADSNFCQNCGAEIKVKPDIENDDEQEKAGKFYNMPFVHESDRKALAVLKAIPGFTPLMKNFIKIWDEKQFKIINLSSNIRIDENQMPEIYNLLPPICEKLGIDIPEIYLTLDVNPNAYTYGDTNPFIVITSGMLETIPFELLSTVIAHECGHIACHHTLYTTIANLLINGATIAGNYFGLGKFISTPILVAFYHWMRCSELSADRAAVYCDGNSDNMIDLCMRFAGYDKDLDLTTSKELFMKQANDYKDLLDSSKWNKTLEFILLANETHPFNAVRAKECYEWTQTDDFKKLI